jgi:hypothetical protein
LSRKALGKESAITATSPGIGTEDLRAGAIPGNGTYFCTMSNAQLSLRESDSLPECPRCGATEFHRDSIFEPMQEHGQTAELAIPDALGSREWLASAPEALPGPGR